MKFFLLAVIVTFVTLHTAFGQWTTSGTNIYNSNTGNVGIGTTTPGAKLTVYQSTLLGDTAKANVLLTSTVGASSDKFAHNTWIVRNSAGSSWYSTRLHDAVSVSTSFVTPQLDTKTWWERDPYNDIQSWGTATSTYLTISAGKVGIGTIMPQTNLEVVTNNWKNGIMSANSAALGISSGGGFLAATSLKPTITGQRLGLIGFGADSTGTGTYNYNASVAGYSSEAWSSTANGTYLTLSTTQVGTNFPIERLRIDNVGNVSINTTSSQGYRFAVKGTAIATSMTVKAYANWPDYVLNNRHKLPSLTNVNNYVKVNHHLPGIPSANDVAKNGLNLGDIDQALVKKTEELTLYAINADAELKKQEEMIKAQQELIKKLMIAVADIEKAEVKK